jgi:DNA polymerase-3 subunit epsilon
MMEDINFTAFDFETAYGHKNACQIGLVIVKQGKIVNEKSYLIQPPENIISAYCSKIHGITPSKTKNAPTFDIVWNDIKQYFEHRVVVHHSDGFDMRVLSQELEYYKIPVCRYLSVESTMFLFPDTYSRSLANLCTAYSIQMEQHHDGLSDARCCAEIFIRYLMGEDPDYSILPKKKISRKIDEEPDEEYLEMLSKGIIPDRLGDNLRELEKQIKDGTFVPDIIEEPSTKSDYNNPARRITAQTRIQDLDSVENKDTVFYDKRVVISGVFDDFPLRNDLGVLLKGYGAKINTSISKSTNIFIVGKDVGPAKLNKVLELKDKDIDIRIIEESELYNILKSLDK